MPSRALAVGHGLMIVLIAAVVIHQQKRAEVPGAASSANVMNDAWESFSTVRLEELRQEGPVFVDFTAAWCVTCQVNKTLVLNRADIQEAFKEQGIRLMRADWTDYNPEITAILESLGRQGVPVYALYAKDAKEPRLLPEVLTPDLLMQEIRQVSSNANRSER